MKITIVIADFYPDISQQLLCSCQKVLQTKKNIISRIVKIPGALEIPYALKALIQEDMPAAMVALGCVIRGETYHFETVSNVCAHGILQVQLETGVPVGNGVLTVDNMAQAQARVSKGGDAAQVALQLAALASR